MKPLFPFYGSKWRAAKLYGAPKSTLVVEPFAGSAGYSIFWEPQRVALFDTDENIVQVWQYLIRAAPAEILALPDLEPEQTTDDLDVPPEAKLLIGFWLNRGSATPKKSQTAFSRRTERSQLVWSARARQRIAAETPKVRHWTICLGSYDEASYAGAHLFVDPPYVDKGRFYRKRLSATDYEHLAAWCKIEATQNHLTVCEGPGATWLPFSPLASLKSTKGRAEEFVWTAGPR